MKTLSNYINDNKSSLISLSEKLIINQQVDEKLLINKDYKNTDNIFLIYNHKNEGAIKIFDFNWPQFDEYSNKVYIDREQPKIIGDGYTEYEYPPGEYKVEIKDIDNIKTCRFMFAYCDELCTIPLFIYNIEDIRGMFYGCTNLNNETKKQWSQIYDFKEHKGKI